MIGPEGSVGPAGPQGIQGFDGPTGPTGKDGATGPQGLRGVEGPAGPAGSTGAAGIAGVTGPQGDAGATGLQGTQGPTGATGPTGPNTGITGPRGKDGATGPQGMQGPTGPPGPAGLSIGMTGPQGLPGATGPTGPNAAALGVFSAGDGSTQSLVNLNRGDNLPFNVKRIDVGGNITMVNAEHFRVNTAGVYEINLRIPIRSKSNTNYIFGYTLKVNDDNVYEDNWERNPYHSQLSGCVQVFQQLHAGDVISVQVTEYASKDKASEFLVNQSLTILRIA